MKATIFVLSICVVFVACQQPRAAMTELTLQEFMDLDNASQVEFVFEVQDSLIARYKEGDVERALCVSEIFNDKSTSVGRMSEVRIRLADAASQKIEKPAEQIVEAIMMQLYCPESQKQSATSPESTTLEGFVALESEAQANLMYRVQDDLISRFEGDQIERALCVSKVFHIELGGTDRMLQIHNTIMDAANQKMDKSAEEISEAVITQIYCPEAN